MRYEIANGSPFGKAFKIKGRFAEVKPGEKATLDLVVPLTEPAIDRLGREGVEVKAVEGEAERLPALTGKNKAELLKIAADEGVEIEDGSTNADIVSALELHRESGRE